jgi:hypothetical protein
VARKTRTAAAKRTSSRRRPDPPKPSPWWKRPLVWVGGLASALVVAAAVAFGTGLGQSLFSIVNGASSGPAAAASGPPVLIDSAQTGYSNGDNFSFVFPWRLILSPSELAALNQLTPNDRSYDAWFTSRGGVVPSPAVQKVVVEGNRLHSVLITDMGIVDHCTSALDGSLFLNGGYGGSVGDLGVVFDLDLAHPVPVNGNAGGSYFTAHSISLRMHEQEIFEVVTSSTRYCQYRISLTVVDGTKTVTELVSNHGTPFKITGSFPEREYEVLYVGSADPGVAAPFVRKNPVIRKPHKT